MSDPATAAGRSVAAHSRRLIESSFAVRYAAITPMIVTGTATPAATAEMPCG